MSSQDWQKYPHTQGACLDWNCPRYGECHCGCGWLLREWSQTHGVLGRVKGRPALWKNGSHSPNRHIFSRDHMRSGGFRAHDNDVPIEKVRPLVKWLKDRCGTYQRVSWISGVPASTLSNIGFRPARTVRAHNAAKIADAVLYFRQQDERADWLNPMEVGRRIRTPQKMAEADKDRRRREAEERRYYRKREK